uniref:Predicted protein n=1 Tax=Hordeum vulgare subsp. vulgare TaxID=112509 RepID=F2DPD2_HORVV|nr:predicted protein [Hordeum vulgare subsp. vulgare]
MFSVLLQNHHRSLLVASLLLVVLSLNKNSTRPAAGRQVLDSTCSRGRNQHPFHLIIQVCFFFLPYLYGLTSHEDCRIVLSDGKDVGESAPTMINFEKSDQFCLAGQEFIVTAMHVYRGCEPL